MDKPYPPVYYASYLHLDTLLDCQKPKSVEYGRPAHDEMLFIIVHQAYELWFRQIIHELDSVVALFRDDAVDESSIGVAVSRLQRIIEIQKLLIDQIRILETMTPLDFLDFRDYLFPASGFQSVQFRIVENKLGLRAEQRLLYNQFAYHTRVSAEHQRVLQDVEKEPSLYDLVQNWLERTPFLSLGDFDFWSAYRTAIENMLAADREVVRTNPTLTEKEKDVQLGELDQTEANFQAVIDEARHDELVQAGKRRLSHKATMAALFIFLYRDQPILSMPYRLLAALVDIDELFTTWRYRHALMVHRMIGTKIGTGGSSGYHYLKSTAENHKVFGDLIDLTTFLIPRAMLPALSPDIRRQLGFHFHSKES
jgi:tryptophan 2,3-dioxygenase